MIYFATCIRVHNLLNTPHGVRSLNQYTFIIHTNSRQDDRSAKERSTMGKDCVQIFLNLKLTSEQQQDIHECIKALEAYFKRKRNIVYEHYLSNMCQQNQDEPVDGYNRLRKAAWTCQFGTLTEEHTRDWLVIGLWDHATKLRLLKEDSLDINKALNICRSSEVAILQWKAMRSEEIRRNQKYRRGPCYLRPTEQQSQVMQSIQWKEENTQSVFGSKEASRAKFQTEGLLVLSLQRKTEAYTGKLSSIWAWTQSVQETQSLRISLQVIAETPDKTDGRVIRWRTRNRNQRIFLKLEEVSSLWARGKQLYTSLEFADPNACYKTKLDCQLDTGATCNVLTHRDLQLSVRPDIRLFKQAKWSSDCLMAQWWNHSMFRKKVNHRMC